MAIYTLNLLVISTYSSYRTTRNGLSQTSTESVALLIVLDFFYFYNYFKGKIPTTI